MPESEIQALSELFAKKLEEHFVHIQKSREDTNELIRQVIKETVNGKIDKLQSQNIAMETKMDKYIEITRPMVEFYNNITWGKRFILGLATFIAAVGVIVKFLIPFFNK